VVGNIGELLSQNRLQIGGAGGFIYQETEDLRSERMRKSTGESFV
jgi:hypothetical protein